jgi:hypothetical protein
MDVPEEMLNAKDALAAALFATLPFLPGCRASTSACVSTASS